jgi:hypothetical protein
MFITKQSFAIAKHCPIVGHDVALSGLQVVGPDGATEVVRKTCIKFAECYKDRAGDPVTGNIVPDAGCLLGKNEI